MKWPYILYTNCHKQEKRAEFITRKNIHVPVEVVCGTVGSQVNGLKFRQDVPPYSSYEHVATKSTWNFSTGGVFIMYLSGKKTSFEMGSDRRNLKVFEFALSNTFIGSHKLAILEKKTQLSVCKGEDCWKQMTAIPSPPIYFEHCNKYYLVVGGYTHDFERLTNLRGKNGCQTWRFMIQEFDPLEDLETFPGVFH